MRWNGILALTIVGLLGMSVRADQTAQTGEFYVNPGLAVMGSGTGDYKNSFSLDAAYLKAIHQIAAFGWEAGYLFGSKLDDSGTSVKILHVAPEIKVGPTFTVSGLPLNAFVLGGGGFYWSHQDGGTDVSSYDHYNGGWNIGAGTQVDLPGNWSVGVEFRRHEIVNKHGTDFTWFTPALRFALLFT